jgi:hypothetical protein
MNGKETPLRVTCVAQSSCANGFICTTPVSRQLSLQQFDTFPMAVLQVYIIISLEGWSSLMDKVLKNSSNLCIIYFVVVIILGNYLMVNMTLVILKKSFTDMNQLGEVRQTSSIAKNSKSLKKESFDLQEFRMKKLWKKGNNLENIRPKDKKRKNPFKYNSVSPSHCDSKESLFNSSTLENSKLEDNKARNSYSRNGNSSISLRRASTKAYIQYAKSKYSSKNKKSMKNYESFLEIIRRFFSILFFRKKLRFIKTNVSHLKVNVDHEMPFFSTSESDVFLER